MSGELAGWDRWAGSQRKVSVGTDGAHVLLVVEGAEGNGEVLITPAQAEAVARWLTAAAEDAERPYAGD